MNSPNHLNYETRPRKYVERRMLLLSLSKIIGALKYDYQYIGLGGLAFTDFKLFHKELNINKMYSIENGGDYTKDKLEFNKPYSCITIFNEPITSALAKLDISKPSIIWLDYDDTLNEEMFTNLEIILDKIQSGSIIIMSLNRQLKKNKDYVYTDEEFKEKFGQYVIDSLERNCCSGQNESDTLQKIFSHRCQKLINERNKISNNELKFEPLYNITYQDGAKMYTFGGIVLDKSFNIDDLNLNDLEYIRTPKSYNIDIPNLTYNESLYLNKILNETKHERDLIDKKIIKKEELNKFKKFYKFLPNFYDVRL